MTQSYKCFQNNPGVNYITQAAVFYTRKYIIWSYLQGVLYDMSL